MGEVIEISIISYKNDIMESILCFMENIFEIHNAIQNVEVMDNWNYENAFNLSSFDEAKKYMNSKIITVTKTLRGEQIGVSIEHFSDNYRYHFWYNPRQELSEIEYKSFLNAFSDYILEKQKENILLCAIGLEVFVDFDMNFDEMVKKSHNVDVWMIKKTIYEKYGLKRYEDTERNRRKFKWFIY